ncbi:hypothetical protein SESBI_42757 [Sesbania bispinosa]|nr:hypothetical protein SESBI_42757 [Sesbania bispinosa]
MVMMCGGAVTVGGEGDEIAPLSSGARRNGEGLLMVLQWQIVGKGEAAIVHRREEVDWKCAIVEEGLRVVVARGDEHREAERDWIVEDLVVAIDECLEMEDELSSGRTIQRGTNIASGDCFLCLNPVHMKDDESNFGS